MTTNPRTRGSRLTPPAGAALVPGHDLPPAGCPGTAGRTLPPGAPAPAPVPSSTPGGGTGAPPPDLGPREHARGVTSRGPSQGSGAVAVPTLAAAVPDIQSGEAQRAAQRAEWRRAISAKNRAQRQGRARRKPPGITGVVVLPPEREQ